MSARSCASGRMWCGSRWDHASCAPIPPRWRRWRWFRRCWAIGNNSKNGYKAFRRGCRRLTGNRRRERIQPTKLIGTLRTTVTTLTRSHTPPIPHRPDTGRPHSTTTRDKRLLSGRSVQHALRREPRNRYTADAKPHASPTRTGNDAAPQSRVTSQNHRKAVHESAAQGKICDKVGDRPLGVWS